MTLPAFLVCSKAVSGSWVADHIELDIAEAVRSANRIVATGSAVACVMEVGGTDAVPMFTFKFATKGPR